ncbi:uncharacterized protein LOC125246031 isoform X2 [Megalobrama amblycephala]|nr:uncharacterized protein LOC125246031 isoform X2 [Megalobrama amblycephala]
MTYTSQTQDFEEHGPSTGDADRITDALPTYAAARSPAEQINTAELVDLTSDSDDESEVCVNVAPRKRKNIDDSTPHQTPQVKLINDRGICCAEQIIDVTSDSDIESDVSVVEPQRKRKNISGSNLTPNSTR